MREPDEVIEDTEVIGEVELPPKPKPKPPPKRAPQKRKATPPKPAAKAKAKPAAKAKPKAGEDDFDEDEEVSPFAKECDAEAQRIHDEIGAQHQAARDSLDARLAKAQERAGEDYQNFRDEYLAVPLKGDLR